LRAALRAPAVLEQAPAPERFAVRAGVLQIDDEVGWLRADPALPADPASSTPRAPRSRRFHKSAAAKK
jgi:hypothetical protein